MCPFNGFDIQIHDACALSVNVTLTERDRTRTFMFTDSGISGIRQWTRLTITQAGDVVFVSAKVLGYGSSKNAIRARNFDMMSPAHLTLYEQNCWFITDQITSSLCIPKLP